jgi:hypothetical protein
MALEGGEGSASRSGRSLLPEKTRYSLYRRLGGPQGRSGQVWKISPKPGFDPRTVQPVVNHLLTELSRPPHFLSLYVTLYEITCLVLCFTETLVVVSKEIGLKVNADKTKYMIMSRDQNVGRSHSIKIDNSTFKNVGPLQYLGTILTI